ALRTDRSVAARGRAPGGSHLGDVLRRELRVARDLLVRRLTSEPQGQLALGARDLLLALDDVDGDPNRARFVGHAALYRLADPPCCVRRALVATAPVELLHGA